jgi:hypothetical protein
MEFYTVDSKLNFDKNMLVINKIKHDPTKRYLFDSFILLGFIIYLQVDKAINENQSAWIRVIPFLILIYPHLERLFNFFFIYKWGNRIRISDIKEITTLPADNELETSVCIKLFSGRQKILIFRTAEKQVENFIDFLKQEQSKQLSAVIGGI